MPSQQDRYYRREDRKQDDEDSLDFFLLLKQIVLPLQTTELSPVPANHSLPSLHTLHCTCIQKSLRYSVLTSFHVKLQHAMHGIGNASDVVRSITIQMVKHIKNEKWRGSSGSL